jgi:flagellar biosynthesis anti-sigma factor FlgM
MKIDDRSDVGAVSTPAAASTAGVEGGGRRTGGAGTAGSSPDTAELSDLAGKISQADGQDAASRAEKLGQLRALVAGGNYQPDAQGISHGIVNEALAPGAESGSAKPDISTKQ